MFNTFLQQGQEIEVLYWNIILEKLVGIFWPHQVLPYTIQLTSINHIPKFIPLHKSLKLEPSKLVHIMLCFPLLSIPFSSLCLSTLFVCLCLILHDKRTCSNWGLTFAFYCAPEHRIINTWQVTILEDQIIILIPFSSPFRTEKSLPMEVG